VVELISAEALQNAPAEREPRTKRREKAA